jgi:hypothetical protein
MNTSILNIDQLGSAHRRSVVILEDSLLGDDLLENLSKIQAYSDENILRSVAQTCAGRGRSDLHIEALSLEVTRSSGSGRNNERDLQVTYRHSLCLPQEMDLSDLEFVNDSSGRHNEKSLTSDLSNQENSSQIASDILDEVISAVVDHSSDSRTVASYFYHPLAGKKDIDAMTGVLSLTRNGLTDSAMRLKEAMRIILVQSARQLVVSYRRILQEQVLLLQEVSEEEAVLVTRETVRRLIEVTGRVTDLTLDYLKNATRHVVDSAHENIKCYLGLLSNDEEEISGEVTHL